jgi:hypothetical protein
MLGHLEQALAREGCSTVTLTYRSNWSSVPAIERLLEKANWRPAVTHSLICKTDRRVAKAPWFSTVSFPAGFTVFPWVDLTAEDKEDMQRRQEEREGGWYPENLTPFQVLERLEPANSLGLRHEGCVVGWMITHRTAPDTVQYTSLFLEESVRGRGLALPLVAEAIIRQEAVEEEAPYGLFQVEVENEKMMSFLDHFLRPYMASLAELRLSGKRLC